MAIGGNDIAAFGRPIAACHFDHVTSMLKTQRIQRSGDSLAQLWSRETLMGHV